jgi:hypothetical protein
MTIDQINKYRSTLGAEEDNAHRRIACATKSLHLADHQCPVKFSAAYTERCWRKRRENEPINLEFMIFYGVLFSRQASLIFTFSPKRPAKPTNWYGGAVFKRSRKPSAPTD